MMIIRKNFEGIFLGQIKNRFLNGFEGIVEVCMCHGQSMNEVLKLSMTADGMVGDDYHPRFVAAMLRLGDLLDVDNGRFPTWFVKEIAQKKSIIPKLSVLHFKKHEAISHLLITPEKIEIMAHCHSRFVKMAEEENEQKKEVEREKALEECYEVAALISEWTTGLSEECQHLVHHWNEIAQPHFGGPPSNLHISIYVDGREYVAEDKALQMKMSQERVMKLLEGTNIYQDKYVGIREMLQNAIDASLLQLWKDLLQNRYRAYGLSKDVVKNNCDLSIFKDPRKASIFENYDVILEVIKDELREKIFVVIKDRGIGITREEVKYIADIGSSKEENERVRNLIETMPVWMRPSGIFGIGLQSVFQLTNRLDFYSRQHNEPEYMISLYPYGKNLGKIEVREMPENENGLFNDNTIPGTNVKIAIEPEKLLGHDDRGSSKLKYYDSEFDREEILDMIFAEVARACEEKIRETSKDYFNIYFESKIIKKDGAIIPAKEKVCWRRGFIFPSKNYKRKGGQRDQKQKYSVNTLLQDLSVDGYSFRKEKASFWDKSENRFYILTVRPCKIIKSDGSAELILPERDPNLYKVNYKFNNISEVETIYDEQNNSSERLRAGLLNLEVLIMDEQPTKYMNIDRDRLREGAINEKELIEARNKILTKWCEFFCEKQRAKDKNIKERDLQDNESNMERRENGYLAKDEGILFSLILLFYRNVPKNLFKDFVKPYYQQIKKMNCHLEGEKIEITDLWNSEKTFQVSVPLSENGRKIEKAEEENEIHLRNISRLPSRLIQIEEINETEDKLSYLLHLKKAEENIVPIKMNEKACLQDYMNAFDEHLHYSSVRFDSAMKKVFKPDRQYLHILVSDFPQTFHKGRNWKNALDYCLNGYILSPFDQETLNMLQKIINGSETSIDSLVTKVMESKQLAKCVSYIMKHREVKEDREKQREEIENDYRKFVKYFVDTLNNNKKVFLNQFKKH